MGYTIIVQENIRLYISNDSHRLSHGGKNEKSLVTLLIMALAVTTAALMSGCGSDTTSSDNTTPDTSPTTQESKPSEPSSQQTTVSDTVSAPESSDVTESSNESSDTTVTDLRSQIVATAEALVGIDYVSGMASPEQGFDNSGLIYYVLRENGFINCPRGTAAQKEMGTSIGLDEIREGDLLFFADKDSETGEAIEFGGIYIGNGKLIYSPYPGEKVKFADINSTYWQNSFSIAISIA